MSDKPFDLNLPHNGSGPAHAGAFLCGAQSPHPDKVPSAQVPTWLWCGPGHDTAQFELLTMYGVDLGMSRKKLSRGS